MKKPEMKDWHCPLWIIGALAFHFVAWWVLPIRLFPNLTEIGRGVVASLGLFPTGIVIGTTLWAVYTNFGKEDVDRR